MKPLKADFAEKRQIPTWLLAGAVIVLALLAAQQAWEAWMLDEQVRAAETELATLQVQRDDATQAQIRARQRGEVPYARDAAEIAKLAGFPLQRVFESIESARVQGVQVTALEIFAAEGSARAQLEFSDYPALMRYFDAINSGEPRARWTLLQAQSGSQSGGGNSATITSSWRPDSR